MKSKIKLFDPSINKNEERAVIKVLKSGFWASGAGQGLVEKFENEFKKYVSSKNCIAVNNGTSALNLALSLIDIKNKEVIVPSLTFVSTIHAITLNGGKPIFVDVEPDTLCLDVEKTKEALSKNTRVILPVHFAGMPCKITEFAEICKNNNCKLIEDAAHAAGTTYKNQKIGSHGFAVCFSFHPVKNLAMPSGGVISINGKNTKKLKNTLKSRRWVGISNRKGPKYDVTDIGWNYYMNEFSSVIGIEQLKKLEQTNSKRKYIAKRYSQELKINKKIPFTKDCSYHLFWIAVNNQNEFMKKMLENNIETGIHYLPIHKMKYYNSKIKLKITEDMTKKIVSLPIHPNLKNTEIDKIIKLTNKFSKD